MRSNKIQEVSAEVKIDFFSSSSVVISKLRHNAVAKFRSCSRWNLPAIELKNYKLR